MITVFGSHGMVQADDTGKVLSYDRQGNPVAEGDYSDIVQFDIEEYKATYPDEDVSEMDVLDVGFWTKDGEYIAPDEEFRERVGNCIVLPESFQMLFKTNAPS